MDVGTIDFDFDGICSTLLARSIGPSSMAVSLKCQMQSITFSSSLPLSLSDKASARLMPQCAEGLLIDASNHFVSFGIVDAYVYDI